MRVRREIRRDGGATARQAAIRTSSTGRPGLAVGPRPDQATRPTSALRCETDSEASALVDDDLHYNGNLAATFFYTTTLGHLGSIDRYKEPSLSLPARFLPSLFGSWDAAAAAADTVDPRFFTRGDLADVQSSGIFARAQERERRMAHSGMDGSRARSTSKFQPLKGRKEGWKVKEQLKYRETDPPLCRGPFSTTSSFFLLF